LQGSFIRVGDADKQLSQYEVSILLQQRSKPTDDEQVARNASRSDLAQDRVEAFITRLREKGGPLSRMNDDELLETVGVLTRNSEHVLVPTLAGLLALGTYPQKAQAFPQLRVTLVVVEGVEMAAEGVRFSDNQSVEGSIPVILETTLDHLRRHLSRRSVIQGAGNTTDLEFPYVALREAIVNALVHRDLQPQAQGTAVQVELYADRLLIRNPGGLYGPVDADSLGEGKFSSARNETLMKVLEDVAMSDGRTVCENRGSGIRSILAALRNAQMSPPIFRDEIRSFEVEFPRHSLVDPDALRWLGQLVTEGLSDNQKHALALMWQGEVMTNKRYREAAAVDSRDALRDLKELVSKGYTIQRGDRGGATYVLKPELREGATEPVPSGPQRRDRRDEVIEFAREFGRFARADVEKALGLSRSQAKDWIKRLIDEGKLVEIRGQSKNEIWYELAP
jgi:ATP-dependent DNA helicase RecG